MRFFFYGTLLMPETNPVARRLHARLEPGPPALAYGRLFALPDPEGWYPAFCPDEGGTPVHGQLFAALGTFAAADLAALDTYEDYRPGRPEASEYVRQAIAVTAPDGVHRAQAYCYNRALPPRAEPIPEGDFAAWLARHGRRGFGG